MQKFQLYDNRAIHTLDKEISSRALSIGFICGNKTKKNAADAATFVGSVIKMS